MSTTSTSTTTRRRHPIITSAVLVALLGSAANALVALGARALGAPEDGMPFQPPAYITLTVVAAVAGALGWRFVVARAAHPARTLSRLVPVVLLVSFAPDAYLGATGAWTWATVLGAAAMHVVTIAVAVAIYAWQLPASPASPASPGRDASPALRPLEQ
jgi:hypothetical protein